MDIYDVGNVLSQEFDARRGRWASGGASPVKRAAAKAPNAKSATSEAADAPKATPKSAKAKGKVSTAGKGRAVMPSKKPRYMFISSVVSSPNSTPPKGEATNRAGHARQAPADTSAAAAWAGAAAAAASPPPSPPSTVTASPPPNVMASPISTAKRGGSTPGSSTPARAGATRTVAKALDTPGRSLRSTPGAKKHIEVQEEGAPPRAAGFASISAKKPQLAALEAVLKGQYAQYANNKPKRSAPKRKAEAKEPTDDDVFLVEKVRVHAAPHSFHSRCPFTCRGFSAGWRLWDRFGDVDRQDGNVGVRLEVEASVGMRCGKELLCVLAAGMLKRRGSSKKESSPSQHCEETGTRRQRRVGMCVM